MYQTIEIEQQQAIATIWLNRPDIRNAINQTMMVELATAFDQLGKDDAVLVIQLKGRGSSFCAGADLNWMRSAANYTYEQNLEDSRQLAHCFYTIYNCAKPTIAVVHGAAMGGANGLLSACDFAYCTSTTVFSLSEIKLGLIPATIGPYVLKRVGEHAAKDIMLTGRKFDGIEAAELKLVNASAPDEDELEMLVQKTIAQLLSGGPEAIAACKKLIHAIQGLSQQEVQEYTAKAIADIRATKEAQEGMSAFLEKRKPKWTI